VRGDEFGHILHVHARRPLFVRHAFYLHHATPSAKHYSIQNEAQLLFVEFLAACFSRNREPTVLEALREQAVSRPIPVHELQVIATAPAATQNPPLVATPNSPT
jgi:hypothetical protein